MKIMKLTSSGTFNGAFNEKLLIGEEVDTGYGIATVSPWDCEKLLNS